VIALNSVLGVSEESPGGTGGAQYTGACAATLTDIVLYPRSYVYSKGWVVEQKISAPTSKPLKHTCVAGGEALQYL
jgi:hypothetical protein